MATKEGLARTLSVLKSATSFVEVFGSLSSSDDKDTQKDKLRGRFAELAKLVHPDHAPDDCKTLANTTFCLLVDLRKSAETAIEEGAYGKRFKEGGTARGATVGEAVIQSSKTTYRVKPDPYKTGDFSSLFPASDVSSGTDVLLKFASKPPNNPLLEKEASLLMRFHDSSLPGNPFKNIKEFVPELFDTFLVSGEDGIRLRVNVMPFPEKMISLTDIIRAFPNGLDPQDVAWIARRVIGQTIVASMAGVVHGALVPDHVLVHPKSHDPLHIGWLHAVDVSSPLGLARITSIIDRWRDWYPPEVFEKKPPDHRTDIFMAGKTIIWLLSGDASRNRIPKAIPSGISELLLMMVEESLVRRPDDGRKLLDEFTRLIREAWGEKYRPLVLPVL